MIDLHKSLLPKGVCGGKVAAPFSVCPPPHSVAIRTELQSVPNTGVDVNMSRVPATSDFMEFPDIGKDAH